MATHSHSYSLVPARPSWAPRTVLVYEAKAQLSWPVLFGLASLLLLAALGFTAYLLLQPLPIPHEW